MNLTNGEKYLFDTTVFLDKLHKRPVGERLHFQVRYWNVSAGYSIVTETELWRGIKGLWTEEQHIALLKLYRRYFINVTIARNAGIFYRVMRHDLNMQPTAIPGIGDCLIAATAKFYDLRLVSRNTRHMKLFEHFDVKVDVYKS